MPPERERREDIEKGRAGWKGKSGKNGNEIKKKKREWRQEYWKDRTRKVGMEMLRQKRVRARQIVGVKKTGVMRDKQSERKEEEGGRGKKEEGAKKKRKIMRSVREKITGARVVGWRTPGTDEGAVMNEKGKGTGESPEGEDKTLKTPHFQIFIYKRKP